MVWELRGVGGKEKDTRRLGSSGVPLGLEEFQGPCVILRASLAELRRVFIFKGAWFTLTLRVPGGGTVAFYFFICGVRRMSFPGYYGNLSS